MCRPCNGMHMRVLAGRQRLCNSDATTLGPCNTCAHAPRHGPQQLLKGIAVRGGRVARLQLLIMDEHRALRHRNTSALFVSGGETSSNQAWTLRYLRPSMTALANGMLARV